MVYAGQAVCGNDAQVDCGYLREKHWSFWGFRGLNDDAYPRFNFSKLWHTWPLDRNSRTYIGQDHW